MTVVLEDGEHRIPSCNIVNKGSALLIKNESRICIRFSSYDGHGPERITFINCGIQLVSIENSFIVNGTFRDSTSGAVMFEGSTPRRVVATIIEVVRLS